LSATTRRTEHAREHRGDTGVVTVTADCAAWHAG
jgi:hypothetical protein